MNTNQKRRKTDLDVDGGSSNKRVTRSITAKALSLAAERSAVFDPVAASVLSSGFLRWYEAEALSEVNKACRSVWVTDLRETYPDWSNLFHELDSSNPSNRCYICKKIVFLKTHRRLCSTYDRNKQFNGSISRWDKLSAQRAPDFHGVVDIVMRSGFLSHGKKVSISRTSKTCYKVHQEHCTCDLSDDTRWPIIANDPRYDDDYDNVSDFFQCQALTKYTAWFIRNLHSHYTFRSLADPRKMKLFGRPSDFNRRRTLQRAFPKRCALIMNVASLYKAQEALRQCTLLWYRFALLGQRQYFGAHRRRYLVDVVSKFCLPATDEVLIKFLRTECYPTIERQTILGPFLVRALSIFGPLMDMVPLDETKSVQLPRSLEKLTEKNMKDMSLPFFFP